MAGRSGSTGGGRSAGGGKFHIVAPATSPGETTGSGQKYDESEFLVGGRGNSAGETEKEIFKIHEGYVIQSRRVVDSHVFPYQSLSDLYRHAVIRHIDYLNALEPGVIHKGLLHQLKQINEVVAWEQRQVHFTNTIDKIASLVSDVLELPNGKRQVGTILRKIRKHIDQTDDDFYRAHFERMFRERFGNLLAAGLGALEISGQEEDAEAELAAQVMAIAGWDDEEQQSDQRGENDSTTPDDSTLVVPPSVRKPVDPLVLESPLMVISAALTSLTSEPPCPLCRKVVCECPEDDE